MDNYLLFLGIVVIALVSGMQTDVAIVKSEERMMNQIEQRFDELERGIE